VEQNERESWTGYRIVGPDMKYLPRIGGPLYSGLNIASLVQAIPALLIAGNIKWDPPPQSPYPQVIFRPVQKIIIRKTHTHTKADRRDVFIVN